jgi:Glu-tRNA(Gln) amidotransferase subunit E-like FAD-binding protein
VDSISNEKIYQTFQMVGENKFSKEAIQAVLEFLADNPGMAVEEAITELDLKPLSMEELQKEVDKVIDQYSNPKNIKRSINIIIGEVMKVTRNRVDGKLVKEVVTKKLGKIY